jgi:hypothetical protein
MSALAASNAVNPNSQNLAQAEADLRTEATAIEKLRKQISEAGSGATKEMMASFAKRQKAYLDRKIDLEKQKRGLAEAPKTAATAVAPAAPAPAPVVEKKPEPAKPVEVAKPAKPSEKNAVEEPAKPAKPSTKEAPAAKVPEAKAPETKKAEAPEIPLKPAAKKPATEEKKTVEKSTESPKERKTESSPEKKGGGISPIIWLLAVASIAVVIWHFASR